MLNTQHHLLVFLGLLAVSASGCKNAETDAKADGHGHGHEHDHDHGSGPDSLHAAVAALTETRDTIRDAILNGDPHDAHGPLHKVFELLEAIPDIAAETDLPKEAWNEVNTANDKLFDAFGAIDKAFHTKDGDIKAACEGVADQLDEALQTIRSKLAMTGEEPDAAHDHDHEGHDHEEHDHGGEVASDEGEAAS